MPHRSALASIALGEDLCGGLVVELFDRGVADSRGMAGAVWGGFGSEGAHP